VALVGESGSGKSVSAMAILGLLPANARIGGQIRLAGRSLLDANAAELRALRGARGLDDLPGADESLNPVFTVGEQIAEVLRLHHAA
jgi:ABC-type microcin C transport system duplicated ATPase subunit YejF